MQTLRTPTGLSEVKQVNRIRNPRLQNYRPSVKRIELDSYSNAEMELYLFFQNHGKYPTENPLK